MTSKFKKAFSHRSAKMKPLLFIICLISTSVWAHAGDDHYQWQPVSDETLSEARAGFVLPNGIRIDLSFQKDIFQNGELLSSTFFSTLDGTHSEPRPYGDDMIAFPNEQIGTLLQNTLDNQVLGTITTVDITLYNVRQIEAGIVNTAIYESLFDASLNN